MLKLLSLSCVHTYTTLLETKALVNTFYQRDNHWLPHNEVANRVQQLREKHILPFKRPRLRKQHFQVYLFTAVRARFLFTNNGPATNAKLMKGVATPFRGTGSTLYVHF